MGVKYCGHCNPVVDTQCLLAQIKASRPEWEWVTWGEPKDGLIILCGCARACATWPPFEGPTVVVAGDTLNGRPYTMAELATQVLQRLLPQERNGDNGQPGHGY